MYLHSKGKRRVGIVGMEVGAVPWWEWLCHGGRGLGMVGGAVPWWERPGPMTHQSLRTVIKFSEQTQGRSIWRVYVVHVCRRGVVSNEGEEGVMGRRVGTSLEGEWGRHHKLEARGKGRKGREMREGYHGK